MSHARPATLTLAAITLVVSGCGGSSGPTLTRAELIAKADPICERANTKFDSTNVSTPQTLASAAPQLAAYERQAAAELASLTPPASMAGSWKIIVSGYQTLAKNLAQLGEHASRTVVANTPIIAELTKAQHDRAVAADSNGFKGCAKY